MDRGFYFLGEYDYCALKEGNIMKTLNISHQAENTFTVQNGRFNLPESTPADFRLNIGGYKWQLCFHKEANEGFAGSVEVEQGNATVGYADISVDQQTGEVQIKNLEPNQSYLWNPGINKQMAGFIKRACYDIAILACMQEIANKKSRKAVIRPAFALQ